MADQRKRLQVVLTAGPHDPARATLALDLATTAAVSGVQVALFLTLDATEWVCEGSESAVSSVHRTLAQLEALGVPITCCATCAIHRCGESSAPAAAPSCAVAPPSHTRASVPLQGLTTLVESIASGIPTVTF